jgi:hypothetical protein
MNSKRINLVHGDIVFTEFPMRLTREVYLHEPFVVVTCAHFQICIAVREINSYFLARSTVLNYADVL